MAFRDAIEMRLTALHVFPTFGPELVGGSDYVSFHLSRELARRDVAIRVLTTCTRQIEARAAFGTGWPTQYSSGASMSHGIHVRRFPVSWSPSVITGHAISRLILDRWKREESRTTAPTALHAEPVASLQYRAQSRSIFYDYLALLGRGPHSRRLLAAARQALDECDVVLAGFLPFAIPWYLTRMANRAGVPIVLLPLFHPEDAYHHFRIFYRCCGRADALLAQTSYSKTLFEEIMPDARAVETGVGIDPGEFSDAAIDGRRFRQRHCLGDAPLLLFVGRKENHKRYDVAVRAVERLRDPRARLILIGADVDHQPLDSPRTLYLGPLPRAELLDAYDACDVFVLPSEHESFGIVFLEAWMRRKPVVGNARCQPVASLITAGVDGFLADGAEELAARFEVLLADPTLRDRLGSAGRAKVLGRYTWGIVASRVHALYSELAQTGRRRS